MSTQEEVVDTDLVLSEETARALKEFYEENSWRLTDDGVDQQSGNIEENWQLSQFWYTEDTADYLSDQILRAIGISAEVNETTNKSIACLSCPTLFDSLYKKINKTPNSSVELVLLEFDRRFGTKYPNHFLFYDYNQPIDESLAERLKESTFDAVVADPPFLSEECIRKTSETIKYLSKDKIMVCTGAVMQSLVEQCLGLTPCDHFEPKHNRKLGNEFKCFANFPLIPANDN